MAQSKELLGFLDFFKTIPDHQNGNHKLHPIEEILLVAFSGVIAGCDGWEDIELFAESRTDFLKRPLPFAYGVPSDDTLRRFFRELDPKIFEHCFVEWGFGFEGILVSRPAPMQKRHWLGLKEIQLLRNIIVSRKNSATVDCSKSNHLGSYTISHLRFFDSPFAISKYQGL